MSKVKIVATILEPALISIPNTLWHLIYTSPNTYIV